MLLERAQQQNRILVTRDRDYGTLVFVKSLGAGVIYLRVLPSTQEAVHGQLAAVLREHLPEELGKAFVVVEPGELPDPDSRPPRGRGRTKPEAIGARDLRRSPCGSSAQPPSLLCIAAHRIYACSARQTAVRAMRRSLTVQHRKTHRFEMQRAGAD